MIVVQLCGPAVLIPLPSGTSDAGAGSYVRECYATGDPRPIFLIGETDNMRADDLEALAHGLLAYVRELRHPEGIQKAPG